MLKIRISGTQKELEQIADLMDDAEIKQFKHKSGKRTFAIDTTMTVEEFLKQNESIRELNEQESIAQEEETLAAMETQLICKESLDNISQELNDLLDVISDNENN
ncbi:MAG: hypothetical protein HQL46_09275 [Gammaproteobacteria bacterium]|nr:hypothetical protein [Gammaproteobacteria bacterium]